MKRYLGQKLISFVLTIVIANLAAFLILNVLPGDPALLMLGTEGSAEAYARLRSELNLDQPRSCATSPGFSVLPRPVGCFCPLFHAGQGVGGQCLSLILNFSSACGGDSCCYSCSHRHVHGSAPQKPTWPFVLLVYPGWDGPAPVLGWLTSDSGIRGAVRPAAGGWEHGVGELHFARRHPWPCPGRPFSAGW